MMKNEFYHANYKRLRKFDNKHGKREKKWNWIWKWKKNARKQRVYMRQSKLWTEINFACENNDKSGSEYHLIGVDLNTWLLCWTS